MTAAGLLCEVKTLNFLWALAETQDTFLHLLVRTGESPEAIELLKTFLAFGAREKKNAAGQMPSDLARKLGYKNMLRVIQGDPLEEKSNFDKNRRQSVESTHSVKSTNSRTSAVSSRERTPAGSKTSSKNSPEPSRGSVSGSITGSRLKTPSSARSRPTSRESRPNSARSSILSLNDDF